MASHGSTVPTIFSGRGNFIGMVKRNPEVLPVVFAAGFACCFGTYCLARSMTRPDVVWTPGKQAEPWNNVSQKTNFKFMGHMPKTIVPDYEGPVDLRGKL